MVKLNTKKIWGKLKAALKVLINGVRKALKWLLRSLIQILECIDKYI
jgi:hypothetical protein